MKKKICSLVCIFALCVSILAGCGGESTGERVVHINMTTTYASTVSLIMRDKKILEKYLPEGVAIEYSYVLTGPDIRDAVISGNADIADVAMMNFIVSRENNLPLTMLSWAGDTPVSVYSHRKDIKSLADFKPGDSISITNKSTNLHVAFLALCKEKLGNAVALDSNLTAIPAADALSSIRTSNDFAGAVFSFPNSARADEIEGLTKLCDTSDLKSQYNIGSVYFTRDDYYKENRDIVEAFLSAQEETLTWIAGHPEEAAELLAETFDCDSDLIVKTLKEVPPVKEVTGYDRQAELLYEAGILTKEPAPFSSLENYDEIVK